MTITETQLKKIIGEEIEQLVDEGFLDRWKAQAKGVATGLKGKAKSAVVGGVGKIAGWADEGTGKKLTRRAAQLKRGAEGAQAAAKLGSIVDSHTNKLTTDLEKLGIKPRGDVARALRLLKNAITIAAKKAGM